MEKEEFFAQKRLALNEIIQQQIQVVQNTASEISTSLPKVSRKFAFNVKNRRPKMKKFSLSPIWNGMVQLRHLELQKQIILSQPRPKYPLGTNTDSRLAIVGEGGKEIILRP